MASLVFIYNADSGLFNTLADMAHKIFSPSTYQCNLCAITHSALGMRKEWQQFIKDLNMPIAYMHKDELPSLRLSQKISLPAIVLKKADASPELLIPSEKINRCRSIQELQQLILQQLKLL